MTIFRGSRRRVEMMFDHCAWYGIVPCKPEGFSGVITSEPGGKRRAGGGRPSRPVPVEHVWWYSGRIDLSENVKPENKKSS